MSKKHFFVAIVAALLGVLGIAFAGPRPGGREQQARKALQQELRRLYGSRAARNGLLGLVVKRIGGPVLFARRSRRRFHPASCTKILTSAAALRRLTSDFRFDTVVLGRQQGNKIEGPLVLWGQGDPSLTHEDLSGFARALVHRGIRVIERGILVDDTFFSRRRFPPGFGKPDDAGYAAPTGAVSIDGNRVSVTVETKTSDHGCQVSVSVDPPSDYVLVSNRARCSRGRALDVSALRKKNRTLIVVRGALRPGAGPRTYSRRIFHPDLFAGLTFKRILEQHGVKVGPVRRGRKGRSVRLLSHQSAPLAELVEHMNQHSDNFYAEQILRALGAKAFGRPGTTAKGLKVVEGLLARSGVKRRRYRLTNGSGLFGHTALSPHQLVRVLEHILSLDWLAHAVITSLPLGGKSGTLASRMHSGPAYGRVRAKTGTLRGVSCLAGYVLDRRGRPAVVFAWMHNGIRGSVKPSRLLQDRAVDAMTRYLDRLAGVRFRPASARLRPRPPRRASSSPGRPKQDTRAIPDARTGAPGGGPAGSASGQPSMGPGSPANR